MAFAAEILLDSISPNGDRLTTMLISYPRIVHQEMTRHRAFSRSVASSRAIPVQKQVDKILSDPFRPYVWKSNQRGMAPGEALDASIAIECDDIWNAAMRDMERHTLALAQRNVSKEIANRLLECFSFTNEVVTSTDYGNFFALRIAGDKAQSEIVRIATLMQTVYDASTPQPLCVGEWHIPMLRSKERSLPLSERLSISAGRCARTSYDTHLGIRDVEKDVSLTRTLIENEPWSPLEHQGTPARRFPAPYAGNFDGWTQHRKLVEAGLDPSVFVAERD